jgi:hypothetical protein
LKGLPLVRWRPLLQIDVSSAKKIMQRMSQSVVEFR